MIKITSAKLDGVPLSTSIYFCPARLTVALRPAIAFALRIEGALSVVDAQGHNHSFSGVNYLVQKRGSANLLIYTESEFIQEFVEIKEIRNAINKGTVGGATESPQG